MCPIKPVKHYFLTCATVAEWLTCEMDSGTACIRQMHAKINIIYSMLVQNIENGKLHRQVDWADVGFMFV